MSSLLEVVKTINKSWKEETLKPASIIQPAKTFSMGTLSADFALGGGIPLGFIITFAGENSSGKSLAACQAIAEYQKVYPDRPCVYVDIERTLDVSLNYFAHITGMLTDENHLYSYDGSGKSAEQIYADIITMQEADNIGLIVLDSVSTLVSEADMSTEFVKDNGMRASVAKATGKFLRAMNPLLGKSKKNSLIIINHINVEVGFGGALKYTEPGGKMLRYMPSLKVRFANRKYSLGDKLDLSESKSDDADGIVLKFMVTKNRMNRLRNGTQIVYRYETGLDIVTDTVQVITTYEIARNYKGITWTLVEPGTDIILRDKDTNEELSFAGKNKLRDYLEKHPDFLMEYNKKISDYINHTGKSISLMDEKTANELLKIEDETSKDSTDKEDKKNTDTKGE